MEQVANLRVVKVLFLFSRWPSIATSTLLLRAVSLSLPPSRWVPDFLLLLLFMLLFLFARRLSQFLPPNTCWQFGRRECRTRLRIFCFPNLSGLRWTCPFSRTLLRWAINVLPVSFHCPSNVPPMSLQCPSNVSSLSLQWDPFRDILENCQAKLNELLAVDTVCTSRHSINSGRDVSSARFALINCGASVVYFTRGKQGRPAG